MSIPITISPSQLQQALIFSLEHRFNLLIVGAPGIGKTEIINQACDAAGMQMIVSHPVRAAGYSLAEPIAVLGST